VFNNDILKFDLRKVLKNKLIIFGNLPYNISSQILVKFLKFRNWPPKYNNLIFMFQKELGEKIISQYPSKNYGRISILTNFRLKVTKKFLVSPNCFVPKPKITSMVIQFQPKEKISFIIRKISNLETLTNIFFSNKRKMINKNIKKILNKDKINLLSDLNLNLRPSNISPDTYYKITELYEKN
jgi:16S rRNA (adenine1518-N6/adenine1519-N6)-dimethyltransferase